MNSITLKVKCGDDIRKFKYPKSSGNLAALKTVIKRVYKLAPSDHLWIKYKDIGRPPFWRHHCSLALRRFRSDNDWITLDTDDDLRLAIEEQKGQSI